MPPIFSSLYSVFRGSVEYLDAPLFRGLGEVFLNRNRGTVPIHDGTARDLDDEAVLGELLEDVLPVPGLGLAVPADARYSR